MTPWVPPASSVRTSTYLLDLVLTGRRSAATDSPVLALS